jgi:hypothetical protein
LLESASRASPYSGLQLLALSLQHGSPEERNLLARSYAAKDLRVIEIADPNSYGAGSILVTRLHKNDHAAGPAAPSTASGRRTRGATCPGRTRGATLPGKPAATR